MIEVIPQAGVQVNAGCIPALTWMVTAWSSVQVSTGGALASEHPTLKMTSAGSQDDLDTKASSIISSILTTCASWTGRSSGP
jgi:hypothetical protein